MGIWLVLCLCTYRDCRRAFHLWYRHLDNYCWKDGRYDRDRRLQELYGWFVSGPHMLGIRPCHWKIFGKTSGRRDKTQKFPCTRATRTAPYFHTARHSSRTHKWMGCPLVLVFLEAIGLYGLI